MLSTNYIRNAFESHFNTTVNIPNNKETLVSRFGNREVIQFEMEQIGMSFNSHYAFNSLLKRFHGMQYLKIKDANRYSCFDAYKVDIDNFTYKEKKLTRVLNEVLECCDTLEDVCLYQMNKHFLNNKHVPDYDIFWYKNTLPQNIGYDLKAVGPLPRNYQEKPWTMTPAIFTAWFGEQYKKAVTQSKQTYYIDFRPLASLIAGNGQGFQSCYGLDCFPYKEGCCYNSSPSAYALSDRTAILYSLADDEKSLTGRAWIYFTPDSSIYFGRLYGDAMTKDVCTRAAQELGFDVSAPMPEPCSVYSIARGNVYCSDSCSIAFGPCTMRDNDKMHLDCTCVSCGRHIKEDTNCLCDECRRGNSCSCEHCGDSMDEDDAIYIEGYGAVCNGCARQCDDCGDWHLRDNVTDIGGSSRYHHVCDLCLDNYSYCEDCEEYCNQDDYFYVDSIDRGVCSYCYRHNYSACVECNTIRPNEDMSTCTDCGSHVCTDCTILCNHCEGVFCLSCISSDGEYCLACQDELKAKEATVESVEI